MEKVLHKLGEIICAYDDGDIAGMKSHSREFIDILEASYPNNKVEKCFLDNMRQTIFFATPGQLEDVISGFDVQGVRQKYNMMVSSLE
ncbi:hypothetical protein KAR91_86240 [Candidatus Pacearchaeota archaeon]|nr:hypothetical protein [Candidatus Pacearchaeota archaeon]